MRNHGPFLYYCGWFVAIFVWMMFIELLYQELKREDIPHCFAELASSHLSVLLTSPKVPGEWSAGCTAMGCWEGTILPILYKQLTPSKRECLLIENLPQAVLSVLFLLVEGGSFFVGVLNLLVPGVQILLTCFCFEPVLSAAAPALGKKLNRAMRNGDMVAAAFLWEQAEVGSDKLAESLKINITLTHLYLEQNNIVAAGALALAAGLLQNRGLRRLYLRLGSVGDEGRRALQDAEKTKKERGEDFRIWWF